MKTKNMAFWEYDLFPYLIWGEISTKVGERVSGGVVSYYIESYQGYVRPLFVLPLKEGKKLATQIDKIKHDKRKADNDTFLKCLDALRLEIGNAGVDIKHAKLQEKK